MTEPLATFYFDFVDPLSFLLERELVEVALSERVSRRALEIAPPPSPLVGLGDPAIAALWSTARDHADRAGVTLSPPALVPWSRKAHELHLFAEAVGAADPIRAAVFEAYMIEGRDIGRVDVLVEIAVAAGLDRTETKVVLDVDRHEGDVTDTRARASAAGATRPPVLVRGRERLEGFHNASALRTFLRYS